MASLPALSAEAFAMFTKLMAAITVLMLAPGAVKPPEPDTAAPPKRAVTAAEKAKVKKYFDTVLFDGLSARWEWDSFQAGFICGKVNAKNRLGAYTGFKPFYFSGEQGFLIDEDSSRIVYDVICLGKLPN